MSKIKIFTLSALFNLTQQRVIFISLSFNIILLWPGFYCLRSELPRLSEQNDYKTSLRTLSSSISFKPRNIILISFCTKKYDFNIFVQLGFSSKCHFRHGNLDWLCQELSTSVVDCSPNSLVAKTLSNLYSDSNCNFQSNDWQKVLFNTDLLNQRRGNLYRKMEMKMLN